MQNAIREVTPLITDHAAVLGLLMIVLGVVFYTASLKSKYFVKFYTIIPPLLLCYFVPGLLNSAHIIDGENSPLATIGSRFFLPSCLILFTLNLDLKEMWNLRKRAGVMFFTGTIGIIIGGPIAVWITSLFAPEIVGGVGPDEVWRGLGTLAGSWIGGSANQVALKEILQPSPSLFSSVIAVDVFVAYIWMAFLLYGATKQQKFDRFFNAEAADVKALTKRMDEQQKTSSRIPEAKDFILMLSLALGGTGIASLVADPVASYMANNFPELEKFSLTNSFFWIVLVATLIGIALSFTPARKFEHAGASKLGTALLYMLIVTIGMQMDIAAILKNPGLFIVGIIWLSIHALLLLLVGKLIKAPFFYFAVGSMSNIGGVASATVTSAAFHPSLVSAGVILAVFSYAIGTYAAWLTAILMQLASPINVM
ncbi:DUF819 family protein [Sphingobacterium haloxyli]|uniref:DUF819 domain-containing protein n=1 Tax=Sphingobacterium haloxyli TaxID=2100533 RepID=A0A2S9J767_9SPHI|nr:DUF819 family protein [Sphingobacterium haloxyli]PRD48612.1 hypothetical protein C5745_05275 [Sphingobacterium haloxyli]